MWDGENLLIMLSWRRWSGHLSTCCKQRHHNICGHIPAVNWVVPQEAHSPPSSPWRGQLGKFTCLVELWTWLWTTVPQQETNFCHCVCCLGMFRVCGMQRCNIFFWSEFFWTLNHWRFFLVRRDHWKSPSSFATRAWAWEYVVVLRLREVPTCWCGARCWRFNAYRLFFACSN